ncbi:immunoglobulin-like domain-containing protein, partial [Bifidobacterium vespertilionis]
MEQGKSFFRRNSGGGGFVKKATVAVAAMAMFAPFVVSGTAAYAAPTDPVEVVVNGADVDAAKDKPNGLSFKGFGVLSANSTSSLLMDYKAQNPEAYWQMINVLFGGDNPIMNTVKIEMGNDQNTSTGPNAATMRSADEYPNVAHEPGFQLAADALKVNPNVKVSILRWRAPAWVKSNDDVYHWYKNTILAVYRQYGYMVDSVNPHINESGPNLAWTKDFANRVKTDDAGFIGTSEDDPNAGFKSTTEKELFHKIRTIISDEVGTGSFGDDMLKDKDLLAAVDIAGYHYNTADQGNNFKTLADQYDKEIWNSEAQASFSVTADRPNNTMNLGSGEGNGTNNGQNNGTSGTGIGGINSALEMANTYVKGFTSSRRTNFVYQPAISAFYDGFQYSSKEVITMHDPWSGAITWDGALAVLEQVSRFAKTGYDTANNNADIWRGVPQASRSDITDGNPPGRGNGANSSRGGATSYMTLAAPDKSDFSTVIVNDSQYVKTYRIKAQDLNLGTDTTMELWETRAADNGQAYNANYVKPFTELQPGADGYYEFQVKPWSIVTATTLDNAENKGGALTARDGKGSQLPSNKEYAEGNDFAVLDTDDSGDKNGDTGNGLLYADDFEYTGKTVTSYDPKTGKDVTEDYLKSRGGDTGATPRYTNDTNGAFEVVKQSDGNHVMRQQVGPGMYNGSFNGGAWNYSEPVTTIGDYRWANYEVSTDVLFEANAGYATVGARQWGNSSTGKDDSPAQLRVRPDGSWDLMRFGTVLKSGKKTDNFKTGANQWNNIAVKVLGDVYTAYINGDEVATYTDAQPQANGRVQLGSSFNFVQFDNLKVKLIDGATPYFTDMIDNMHQRSWEDNSTALLAYNEKWQHLNGQGMYVYKRSVSNSTAKGATLTYTFSGTGIDLLGGNNGKAKLNVTVDGVKIAANAATIVSDSGKPTTFLLRGLKNGQHTVTFETADDNAISIDAVGVVKATADSNKVDTTALRTAVDSYADLKAEDWNAATWAVFAANLAEAKAALADPAGYGLDVEGAQAIIARLAAARKALVDGSISDEVINLGFAGVAATKTDASTLPAKLTVKGSETAVTWDEDAASKLAAAADYTKVTLSGVTTDKQADGFKYRFTIEVEALPANVVYFIDSGTNGTDSPEYTAVKNLLGAALLNDKVDQTSDGSKWGYDANAMKVKGNVDINDKQATGLYSDDDDVTYYLPLKAGVYKLTAGFREWWGQNNRESAQAVIAADGSTLATGENVKLGKDNPNLTGTVTFTVPTDQTVKYVVSKVGDAQKPVISWVAVAESLDYGFAGAAVKGTELPKTITVGGMTVNVASWDADVAGKIAGATDYTKVTVSGKTTANKAFTAELEALPESLQYFIDSGTGGKDSPEYAAVKAAVPTLLNNKVDQESDGTTWGYNKDGQSVYGSGDINDKFSTGLWAGKGKSTIYYLPLEAGTYTLTAGFHEWWGVSRSMKVYVLGADGKELSNGNADLSGQAPNVTSSGIFTLTTAQTVTLKVDGVSADPVISWLAVSGKAEKPVETTDLGVFAAVSGKDLPTEVAGKTVAWSEDSVAAFKGASAYQTVAVTGTTGEGEAQQAVKATVEVIPEGLTYFIDSGTDGTDSPEYTAVRNAVADLANDKVDQTSDGSKWGYDANAMRVKAGTDINDKQSTGLYSDDDDIVYYLPLKAGTYTLDAGFREWWGQNNRESAQAVIAADGSTLAAGENVKLGKDNPNLTGTVTFTVPTDQTVKYVVSKVGDAQKPVISWVAVAKQKDAPAVDKTAPVFTGVEDASVAFGGDFDPLAGVTASDDVDGDVTKSVTVSPESVDTFKAGDVELTYTVADAAGNTATAKRKVTVKAQDLTALKAAVDEAGKLVESDYTPESWSVFAEKLEFAKGFLGDPLASQHDVDAAVAELKKAQDALVKADKPSVDKSDLQAAVDAAGELKESDYTAESWAKFASALAMARDALGNAQSQDEVDQALWQLVEVRDALVKADKPSVPDTSALTDAVAKADQVDPDDWVADEAWLAFEKALSGAKTILLDPSSFTQAQVDQALRDLTDAQAKLTPAAKPQPVRKHLLAAQIQEIQDLIDAGQLAASDWTADSWKALEDALAHAYDVYRDPSATQEQVDQAREALVGAWKGLVRADKPVVDKSRLAALIQEIDDRIAEGSLAESDWTAGSWKALLDAKDAALAVWKDPSATQERVDAARQALSDAWKGLEPAKGEPVVNKTALQALVDEYSKLTATDYTGVSWKPFEA